MIHSTLATNSLSAPSETGSLGVPHLKRSWSRWMAARSGARLGHDGDYHRTMLVLSALGVGLEQTMQYVLREAPDFAEFEDWIVRTAGQPHPATIARIRALVLGEPVPREVLELHQAIDAMSPVLSATDLAQWNDQGYVVVKGAVSPTQCAEAAQVVWDTVGATEDDEASWYAKAPRNIMVQRFQHPAFETNRRSLRIHKAFAQLWGTADLWRSTDRCGFNVPERADHLFQASGLHWDVSLQLPIPFCTQGILYLTDTPPEQGALRVVPRFQHTVGDWLRTLPSGADPRSQDLQALGAQRIGGKAGDLVIWHQALPHGASPNHGKLPRLVQYINMFTAEVPIHSVWL